MKKQFKHIIVELLYHLPFTMLSVAFSLLGLSVLSATLKTNIFIDTTYVLFHTFHLLHIFFSACATTSMFWRHERKLIKATLIGSIGGIGICGLSDIYLPYLAGKLLGVEMEMHICIIEHPSIILPFMIFGVIIGLILPKKVISTIFSHLLHVLISSMASILYLITFGLTEWTRVIGMVFIYMVLAVIIPCCTSDIVFPLLLTQKEKTI